MNTPTPHWTTLVDVSTLQQALTTSGHADAEQGGRIRLVDARFSLADAEAGRDAYQQSHLPGAVYADLNRDLSDLSKTGQGRHPLPDSDVFRHRLGQWGITPRDQVVVYDANDGSMAAARLWWMLRLLGHQRVAVLDGGLAAWRAAGLAESTDRPQYPSTPDYPGRFALDQQIDAAQVEARLQQAPGWLLDARAGERFRGDVEPIDARAGHVPGAVNHPFSSNLVDGHFKPVDVLRSQLQASLRGHPADQVVLMCGSGVTACHLLLAMEHAGLSGARIFPPSWSGWISDPSHPVSNGG
ncbi:sulfurtransferase [Pseudoxanthomonas dokdonensis]|uniref:Sulfurtransferase n=1 Tax=Pseudoxanthomonas dokdonensis TaxID=344882 RepID=A0A0R0CHG4_9GAMM|nr:sulfurtransferase [Pseudoxanthomonas dokdonensis]KRG68997.1 sulfurtransferase [Pseudoxanthomonas dokdonensis]